MVEAALYILIGIAFYGGGHQLYLGARRAQDHPHVIHAGMYFLLAVFALCAVLSYQAQTLAALLPLGKLSITVGILLWVALTWFIAAYTDVKPRPVLALLSMAWAILLISNIGAPYSLLYSDITPISQALPSGQTQLSWQTSINPWWWAVELAMLATLGYCLYATYRLFRGNDKQAALALGCGLVVLAVTSLADLLVSMELLQSAYLTPFGFMVFLLACSIYPGLQAILKQQPGAQAPSSYNLTFNLHQPRDQVQAPLTGAPMRAAPATDIEHRAEAGLALEQAPPSPGFAARIAPETVAVPHATDAEEAPAAKSPAAPAETAVDAAQPPPARKAAPRPDDAIITLMSDNLIDIAVHATMLINRVKRGDLDPDTVEELCNKVRTQAIETRRVASRLIAARRDEEQGED
jgi:hypothetical protein